MNEIKIFEKNNPNVSINMYSLEKYFQKPQKLATHKVYPLKVVKEEKTDHFDLFLITQKEKSYYTYIKNFARLVCSQITLHEHSIFICKSCFATFNNTPNKYKLSGQAALNKYMMVCGSHKSILPVLPKEG